MRIVLIILVCWICGCNSTANETNSKNDWMISGFVKEDSSNPILSPDSESYFKCPLSDKSVRWESKNVLNPAAIVKDGKVYMLFRAQDSVMTSRLGLAISEDGINFVKRTTPVFYPSKDSMQIFEWPGGVEDPRIVESAEGVYILTYTAYDGKTARLCVASSTDLMTWKKHGPVLKDSKYSDGNYWSKSGAIVCKEVDNRIIAAKINGKYWMYFGDTNLFIASSSDLINWQIAESEESGKPISVMHPRPGFFDSRLVEPGPYALLQKHGILLIYNGSNAANLNDPSLQKFTYSAGQALFDKNAPYRLINRADISFIRPDRPYEKVGEVNEVCFVEGLVRFKEKWFLYYGTADSKIAVAISK